jgi:hypothetical protein
VQVGSLVNDRYSAEQLRIGYDGIVQGYEARWESEENTQPTTTYCEDETGEGS